MLIIYATHYCDIMKSQRTGVGHFTLALHWIGTILSAHVTFTCPAKSTMSYINSRMTHPKLHSTRHSHTSHRYMVQTCNMPPKMRPPLSDKQCTTIQKITGSVLYYSEAVDPTVLMPLNDIATEQTKVTERKTATGQLLDYLATHPDAKVRFHASYMIFHIHSDASYLSVSKARSRLGGILYLG
jgi:hypothetical protein